MKRHPAEVLWPDPKHPDGSSIAEQSGTGSRKRQGEIIRENLVCPEFVRTIEYALNPFKMFFLNVVPGLHEVHSEAKRSARRKEVDLFDAAPKKLSPSEQFSTMFDLLDKLSTRKLSPNSTQAKRACLDWARYCSPGTISVFRSILKKDLKCGIRTATFNKIKPEWIPEFRLSLARPFNPDNLKFPCFVDPKFDGERCLAQITFDGEVGDVFYMSRYGNELYNYKGFSEELVKLFRSVGNCIVDCEGISKLGFQHRMQTPKWEDPNFDTSQFQLIVFDCIPQAAWDDQFYRTNQSGRYEDLTKLFRNFKSDKVILIQTRLVKNHQELESVYDDWVSKGLEGVICKQPEGEYHFSTTSLRNPGWMKLKPKEAEDLMIVGLAEGEAGHMWEGKAGALIVARLHEGKPVRVNVGSGLTHWDHENLKAVGDQILYRANTPDAEWTDIKGSMVEVVFDNVTEAGSLRFPRVKNRGGSIIRTS